MSQTANGRDILGVAREVTGEVALEETSRGTITHTNGDYEQTVHDPRTARLLQRMLEELVGLRAEIKDLKTTLVRKL